MSEAEYKLMEYEAYSEILAEQINLAMTVKRAMLRYEQAEVSSTKAAEIVQDLVKRANVAVQNLDI